MAFIHLMLINAQQIVCRQSNNKKKLLLLERLLESDIQTGYWLRTRFNRSKNN